VSSLISTVRRHGLEIDEAKGAYFFPDKIEGPLDAIAEGSARMRGLAERTDAIVNKLPVMRHLGRYLALSCRRIV
jgi:hypothetical protein